MFTFHEYIIFLIKVCHIVILIIFLPDMLQQGLELSERPHVVIATPGRLADHIDSGTNFSLKKLHFLVWTPFAHFVTITMEDHSRVPYI